MASTTHTEASLLLRVVSYAAEGDVQGVAACVAAHQDILQLELVLRILLTYLPESTEPSSYISFLQDLVSGNISSLDATEPDATLSNPERGLSDVRALPLLPLPPIDSNGSPEIGYLTSFLVARAHRIDQETGSLTSVLQLIEPFASTSTALRVWTASTLLPLLRIEYEYYWDATQIFNLASFEGLRGRAGLYTLLFDILRRNKNSQSREYARDFRGILGPWIQGEIWRTSSAPAASSQNLSPSDSDKPNDEATVCTQIWEHVFEALLDHVVETPSSIVELGQGWDGPDDIDCGELTAAIGANASHQANVRYAQMMLATLYLPSETGLSFSREQRSLLLRRAASLIHVDLKYDPFKPDLTSSTALIPYELLSEIATIHLARGELLDSSNPLTSPAEASVLLAALFTASTSVLESLGEGMPVPAVASISLFGYTVDQRKRAQKILKALVARSSAGDGFWREVRQKMLWLRTWNAQSTDQAPRHGVFCRVSREDMETDILKTLIKSGRFKMLSDVYVSTEAHLSAQVVEKTLIEVALAAYDSSENGNKTRGEMKQALDIISTFRFQFPKSSRLQEIHYLIQATHALSFYTIRLDHGRPCVPGQLRTTRNPLGVIERLLAQNPKSYTKLDDLIDIGRNLVRAGMIRPTNEGSVEESQDTSKASDRIARQIIAKAVEAALSEDDFDTAYSYIVNRLSLSRSEAKAQKDDDEQADDPLWQAAFLAGRYRPQGQAGSSELRRIEQRMELLSQAAQLAPSSSLQEILKTWRECEEELNVSISKETEEEDQWNYQGDRTVPGGFSLGDVAPLSQRPRERTRGALSEEAPMGLFDVARGAATAFSKSAFPLGGLGGRAATSLTSSQTSPTYDETEGSDQPGRVRKRDMVSSAVTGGIASGIGWVIGAAPAREE